MRGLIILPTPLLVTKHNYCAGTRTGRKVLGAGTHICDPPPASFGHGANVLPASDFSLKCECRLGAIVNTNSLKSSSSKITFYAPQDGIEGQACDDFRSHLFIRNLY